MEFQRFVRTHLSGLRILPLSTTNYVPGVILDREKLRIFGHCREVLPDVDESVWKYGKAEANMIYGSITANRKLNSGVKVMGIFSLGGKYDRDISVHLEINDIRGASLNISQMALQPKIIELRSIDRRGRWRLINGKLVVMETFFASEFTATFFRHDQMVTQAELEEITRIDVDASVDYQWKSGRQLVVTQNSQVPFGVRGFVV
jgi:hypothetical protein